MRVRILWIVGVLLLACAVNLMMAPTSNADREVGRFQIAAVHSDVSRDGSMGDSVYRVDTSTGDVCHLGQGMGPVGINECR
jgi:hypothetical protein